MDLYQTIQDLYAEKARLERVIASLEALLGIEGALPSAVSKPKRGRKSMDAKERLEVSSRMKRYWERRRKEKAASNRASK